MAILIARPTQFPTRDHPRLAIHSSVLHRPVCPTVIILSRLQAGDFRDAVGPSLLV